MGTAARRRWAEFFATALLACLAGGAAGAGAAEDVAVVPFVDSHVHLNDEAMQLGLMERFGATLALVNWGRKSDNESIARAAGRHPQRFIAFASISPERASYRSAWDGDDPRLLQALDALLASGRFKGIGEISAVHFPSPGLAETDYDPTGATMTGVLALARKYRVPVLLHLHGGGFYSGNKAREARPLIRHLTSRRGFVCVSADYRLQPHVTLADQVADARAAIAWIRTHAAGYGAEPGMLFVTGSSAGANLAIRAVCEGETGIAGLICRYGYYGDLAPRGDMPPMLVVHGEKDMWISPSDVRAFVERVRAVSGHPVIYAELPGAHHDFDVYESIRSAAVSRAVEQFIASAGTGSAAPRPHPRPA